MYFCRMVKELQLRVLLKEEKKTISLDNFVKVKNVIKREILPNKREANLIYY